MTWQDIQMHDIQMIRIDTNRIEILGTNSVDHEPVWLAIKIF